MNQPTGTAKKSHGLWIITVEALVAVAVTGVLTFAYYGLQRGYLDWTGICQIIDEDRQIRHCLLFGENPSHYPPSSVEPKKLLSNHSEDSKDKSLRIGIDADKYRVGDIMKLQISVAKPLFVNVIRQKASGYYSGHKRQSERVERILAVQFAGFPDGADDAEGI